MSETKVTPPSLTSTGSTERIGGMTRREFLKILLKLLASSFVLNILSACRVESDGLPTCYTSGNYSSSEGAAADCLNSFLESSKDYKDAAKIPENTRQAVYALVLEFTAKCYGWTQEQIQGIVENTFLASTEEIMRAIEDVSEEELNLPNWIVANISLKQFLMGLFISGDNPTIYLNQDYVYFHRDQLTNPLDFGGLLINLPKKVVQVLAHVFGHEIHHWVAGKKEIPRVIYQTDAGEVTYNTASGFSLGKTTTEGYQRDFSIIDELVVRILELNVMKQIKSLDGIMMSDSEKNLCWGMMDIFFTKVGVGTPEALDKLHKDSQPMVNLIQLFAGAYNISLDQAYQRIVLVSNLLAEAGLSAEEKLAQIKQLMETGDISQEMEKRVGVESRSVVVLGPPWPIGDAREILVRDGVGVVEGGFSNDGMTS